MLELLEPYPGHRGRVCALLETSGLSAPRYGPRQPIQPISERLERSSVVLERDGVRGDVHGRARRRTRSTSRAVAAIAARRSSTARLAGP